MFGFRMLSRLKYAAATPAIFQRKEGRKAATVAVALDSCTLQQDEAPAMSTSSSMGSPWMIADGNDNSSCSPRMDKQKKKKKKRKKKRKRKLKLKLKLKLKRRTGLSGIPLERLDSTLSLLQEYGLSASQMCAMLIYSRALLYSQPETSVRPRLEQLMSLAGCCDGDGDGDGSGRGRVARVVSSKQHVLSAGRQGERLCALVGGVDEQAVAQLLWRNPRALRASRRERVAVVKEGQGQGTPRFERSMGSGKVRWGRGRGLGLLVDLGFKQEQALLLLRRAINIMYLRPETVGHRVQLARDRGWPLGAIVSHPIIVTCSLQRRLLPRFRVIDALRARQLLPKNRCRSYGCFHFSCLSLSEHQFRRRYIDPFVDRFPELPHIYSSPDASSSSS